MAGPGGPDRETADPGSVTTGGRHQKGKLAVQTESAKTFARTFRGYDPAAVDDHIELLTTKQQFLLNDVDSLRARLKEAGDEAVALRKEVAALRDTSTVTARNATPDGANASAGG